MHFSRSTPEESKFEEKKAMIMMMISSPLDILGGGRIYDPVLDNHITCHIAAGTRQKAAQAHLQQYGNNVFLIYLLTRPHCLRQKNCMLSKNCIITVRFHDGLMLS
jgi:hypothetical protein